MKLIIAFLVVSAGTLFANFTAQEMKMDLQVEDKSLVEVMDLLKLKSGFSFIYSAADVEGVKELTLNIRNKTIREILDVVLRGTNLMYDIEDEIIILRKVVSREQDKKMRIVTGTVVDRANDTLPGVTVLIRDTSKGVVTDKHGKYTIALPGGG